MKKIIIILLCVVVAGIGVGIFLQTQKSGPSIEGILPQEALIYVHMRDVEQNMSKMVSMPFWQAVRNVDYDLLMKRNALSPQQSLFIGLIKNQISEILTNPLTKKLFGREIVFAIYPPSTDVGVLVREMKILNPKIVEELLSGLFLVTRIDRDVQFAEFVSRFFNKQGANISQGQGEYKEEIIHTVTLTDIGVKFGIVRLNDLLVVGIGEKAVRKSVDVFKQDSPALAQDPKFTKVQSTFLDPSGVAGFLNFEAFLALLKDQVPGSLDDEKAKAQWEDVLAKMSGFKAFGFSSQLAPFVRFDSDLLFNSSELNPEYKSLYTCPAVENKTINFIPKEVLGYQWSNCFQLDHYWRQIQKEMARTTDAPTSKVNDFEVKMGLSIERDILPTFGDEIGGYISDIKVGGLFPIPKILFFVEIKNKSKAQQLLGRLKEQPFAMLQDENYNGVGIKYLALPLGESVQPGYCFFGDYLLVATSRQLLKDSIDASKTTSMSLLASPDFKKINFGLTDKNRSVQFVKVGQVIEKARGLIGWSNQWMDSRGRKAQAFKAGGERPLDEAKANIAEKEGELKEARDSIILLEDEIWNLESKGTDTSAQKVQLEELKNQAKTKQLELDDARERKEDIENIVQKPEEDAVDPALRKLYLDEVVYPVLEGLKSIKAYGLRVTVDGDAFESSVFLNVED